MAITTQVHKPVAKAAKAVNPAKSTAITGKETKPVLRTEMPGPRSQAIVARDGAALATTT